MSASDKITKDSEENDSLPSTSKDSGDDIELTDNSCVEYAGISSDIIYNYAEQSMSETNLTEDACNILTEDINYKLRYIIHDALLKARLCGRGVITSRDIEETFSNLSIEKVYGASTTPSWIPFSDPASDQTLYYLDDNIVNLIELSEEENTYDQAGDISLIKTWHPDPDSEINPSPSLKNYFTAGCEGVISDDEEIRQMVLKDISENPHAGPALQWFYNFGYFLLIKDITYDGLTFRALNLVETLENSPLSSGSVSVKALQLLVRLLLQRLLLSYTSPELLNRMCFTLSILCLRVPLMELTIAKVNQNLEEASSQGTILPVLTIIYYLGVDAVKEIFLPQITFFLDRVADENNGETVYVILSIYGLICKAELEDNYVHNWFDITIPNELVSFWKSPIRQMKDHEKLEINFVLMKSKLIKTRRKVDCTITRNRIRPTLEEIFSLPSHDCKIRRRLEEYRMGRQLYKKETRITVGKTSLLLSVLNTRTKSNVISECCDHSLLSYNL